MKNKNIYILLSFPGGLMTDYTKPNFDDCRNWITNARKHNCSWAEIKYGREQDEAGLKDFLSSHVNRDFWPPTMTVTDWYNLVQLQETAEKRQEELTKDSPILIDHSQDNAVTIPVSPFSSWQLYKKHLLDSGFKEESVNQIEHTTYGILKRLNRDTRNQRPVKGLVIGHVQSGKTANMAALMAMAADWGWNFFVVLSGTIENLRKQTQQRLLNDLNRPGFIIWTGLEQLSSGSNKTDQLQELRLEDDSNVRYFNVCLKNSTRLANLLQWMHKDKNKMQQLKMLVIDDEADQASVNTANIDQAERTKINNHIINLVEGRNHKGEKVNYSVKAMNYISYTATPYANFLNESSTESLYPSNFIRALSPSDEYFGPKQIFGMEGTQSSDGLDIIRTIPELDIDVLRTKNGDAQLPDSMIQAICWFICCTAAMRVWKYKKPVSMLIHTSQRQEDHDKIAELITDWFSSTTDQMILDKCESLWNYETKRFTKYDFRQVYPNYGRSDIDIEDYPSFDSIKTEIIKLIKDLTHIPLNQDKELTYEEHIHLCIDNCSKNGIDEDGYFVRLAYPDPKSRNYPKFATAFIVIGGSTLSRGLTIEGLVSTYFLRGSIQADTLMQMGRWFGYRRGYELLPRIWMSEKTIEKFKFLTVLEEELRDDLKKYSLGGALPTDYGPRVKNSPKISWMRVTAKNKMQGAMETDLDFSGTNSQLIIYEDNKEILESNIRITEAFLQRLGTPEIGLFGNSYVWRDVDFKLIEKFLLEPFDYVENASLFNSLEAFYDWVNSLTKSGTINNWNVVVAGTGQAGADTPDAWNFGNGIVGKVNRSKKIQSGVGKINIGVLRDPKDLIADVKKEILDESDLELIKSTLPMEKTDEIRNKSSLGKVPQLLIYRINANSVARGDGAKGQRANLNATADLIGLSIYIPGNRTGTSLARTLTVTLKPKDIEPSEE